MVIFGLWSCGEELAGMTEVPTARTVALGSRE